MLESVNVGTLKEKIRESIKNSGFLNEVKATIRLQIVKKLSSRLNGEVLNSNFENPLDRLTLSCIFQHLQRKQNLQKTLSVFLVESGVGSTLSTFFSRAELSDLLSLGNCADTPYSILEQLLLRQKQDTYPVPKEPNILPKSAESVDRMPISDPALNLNVSRTSSKNTSNN
jgi:hypothetical protein